MKVTLSKSKWEQMGKKAGWMKTAAKTVPMGQFGLSIPQANDARMMGPIEANYQLEFSFKGNEFILGGAEELPSLISELVNAFQQEIQEVSRTSRKMSQPQPAPASPAPAPASPAPAPAAPAPAR